MPILKNLYQLIVQATDKGSPALSSETTLTFRVYTTSAIISATDPTVYENVTVGSTITIVTATDPVSGTSTGFVYSLVGPVSKTMF